MPAAPRRAERQADQPGPVGTRPVPQPFLHEIVTCVRAPSTVLSGRDGQVRVGGVEGWFRHDVRLLSELRVMLREPAAEGVGDEPEAIGFSLDDAGTARFAAVSREHGDPISDPTVYLERGRRVEEDRLIERVSLTNHGRLDQAINVEVRVAADHASVPQVKKGTVEGPDVSVTFSPERVEWSSAAGVTSLVAAPGPDGVVADGPDAAVLHWRVALAAGTSWEVELLLAARDAGEPTLIAGSLAGHFEVLSASRSLQRLAARGVADLGGLAAAFRDRPDEVFATAGSPWYLTLFGRDSLWSARLSLPLGTELARGTLRALARRQGSRHDPTTGEQPGKILHEIRSGPGLAGHELPPLYYGTVDATMLWVSLLHDAWRWGLPEQEVTDLLPNLHRALEWILLHADPDGDGLVEYLDESGSGLANQGWKDSPDAVPHADGRLAPAPLALCEVQAYAVRACRDAAALLEALDPAAEASGRCAQLRRHADSVVAAFRAAFWVEDDRGRFPAIAVDGNKEPVASATSNLGHLLATGLLDAGEEALVAARLGQPDLDCGRGLRTLSADHPCFNPVGYHTGSVWPHDTAIAVLGLARAGHGSVAASLAAGLVTASESFQARLPELFGGSSSGQLVVSYPASCRPQAWSAAAGVAMVQVATGLEVDVPSRTVSIAPRRAFESWWPLQLSGVQIGGHAVDIVVDRSGRTRIRGAEDFSVIAGEPG